MSVLDTRTIPNFVMLPFTQSRVSNSDKASARLWTRRGVPGFGQGKRPASDNAGFWHGGALTRSLLVGAERHTKFFFCMYFSAAHPIGICR